MAPSKDNKRDPMISHSFTHPQHHSAVGLVVLFVFLDRLRRSGRSDRMRHHSCSLDDRPNHRLAFAITDFSDNSSLSASSTLAIHAVCLLGTCADLARLALYLADDLVDCALDLVLDACLALVMCGRSPLLGYTSGARLGRIGLGGCPLLSAGGALARWLGGDGSNDSGLRVASGAASRGHFWT